MIVSFPGNAQTTLAEVGGKGYSLIRMVEAGFPVPPGVVLTTEFFAPWFSQIQASATWSNLVDATPDTWTTLCNELKGLCPSLLLNAHQRQALTDLRECLAPLGGEALWAVRSSSPEEDLASASFAGGYETRLGVRLVDLEAALRHCFASSLDERVFIYKSEHGFEVLSPRIAVVVQQQIDSEVAGVGFSINPVTNDYDEAVIEANWGQGESVVSGLASPDHFVINKVSGQVVAEKPGAKELSIQLGSDGGISKLKNDRAAELTLNKPLLGELTEIICRIENHFDHPIDIEWAHADGQFYILQARPITAYVPLSPEMMTRPGERRMLYTDIALSSGFTINAPISPMGLAWMEEGVMTMVELSIGRQNLGLTFDQAMWFFAGSRMYQNLSNVMWLVSLKKMAKAGAASDPLMSDILAHVDEKKYRAPSRPPWARFRMLVVLPRVFWRLRRCFANVLWTMLAPERAHLEYRKKINAFETEFIEQIDYNLPLDEFRHTYAVLSMRHLFDVTMAALGVGLGALALLDRVLGKKIVIGNKALVERLKLGFTDNVVVGMGIAQFRLAKKLQRSDFADLAGLAERIDKREMPADFLIAWDAFMVHYGCRGPLEMDLASPRYADEPGLALRQMSFMTVDDSGFDPEAAHQHLVEQRRQAYESLMKQCGWPRRALLRRIHRIIELFAGARDMPKHHNLLFHHALRKRVIHEGERLVRQGRLDSPGDIFDLTFDDLEAAALQPSLNLRETRQERSHFRKKLLAQVRNFPAVIDSRGRILRPPPRQEMPGELRGMAISPGVVTGPVKLLHNPYEKSVDKGDILVAHSTDPGWTPLFVNAAAIVLEVGGVLQHGAVVAREYGKPCVAGIDGLMTKLQDDQFVEVDGNSGVIRLLPDQTHGLGQHTDGDRPTVV